MRIETFIFLGAFTIIISCDERTWDNPEDFTGGIEMVTVEGDYFTMGNDEDNDYYTSPSHSVYVSTFQIGKFEITTDQFCKFLNDIGCGLNGHYNNTLYINLNDDLCYVEFVDRKFVPEDDKNAFPVYKVTWFGASAYCEWAEGRLPTEAEWEFAARGGIKSNGYQFSGSDDFNEVAWNKDNSNGNIHQIGTKTSNELGIYDMSGNVQECCSDWFEFYTDSDQFNPNGPPTGKIKVSRGGGYWSTDRYTVYYRSECDLEYPSLGFRIAKDIE